MKSIIKKRRSEIKTTEDLTQIVQEVWDSFPQESIDSLVLSFAGRLRILIDNDGNSIADILRNSIHNIPEFPLPDFPDSMNILDIITMHDPNINDDVIQIETKRPWTPEEDKRIVQMRNLYGNKWTIIAAGLENRTALSVRNRWKILGYK